MKPFWLALASISLLTLSACSGGGSSPPPPPPGTYTIGGTVSGPSGSGLVLQDNGGDNLAIGANGSFTFDIPVARSDLYSVAVLSDPAEPPQRCVVSNGSGWAEANVTNVQVACYAATNGMGEWAWMGGSQAPDQPGSYGTGGVFSAGNSPGGRMWACSWTDSAGNLWLFGGLGFASTSTLGLLNDLWEYSSGKWAWMGGSDQGIGFGLGNQPGIYGTMGVADAANQPGARDSATCWTDPQGNLWLYGGSGFDSTATAGNLGDLWRYSNGEWTWMAGSNIAAQPGIAGAWQGAAVYGTEGVAAPGNTPGMREWASGWADSSGNLWLFGGGGVASAQGSIAEIGAMNDLWKYSNGMWAWMAGSDQVDLDGTYGTLGTPAPANTPGTRSSAASWTDPSGNLWLFGGLGTGAAPNDCATPPLCVINDLWEFKPSLNEWTWVGGPDLSNQPGIFGTQGVADPANLPRRAGLPLPGRTRRATFGSSAAMPSHPTPTTTICGSTATANGRGRAGQTSFARSRASTEPLGPLPRRIIPAGAPAPLDGPISLAIFGSLAAPSTATDITPQRSTTTCGSTSHSRGGCVNGLNHPRCSYLPHRSQGRFFANRAGYFWQIARLVLIGEKTGKGGWAARASNQSLGPPGFGARAHILRLRCSKNSANLQKAARNPSKSNIMQNRPFRSKDPEQIILDQASENKPFNQKGGVGAENYWNCDTNALESTNLEPRNSN
jgi:hypothetical protein